jgi:hypothetical protein
MSSRLYRTVSRVFGLLMVGGLFVQASVAPALAKDFDVTGTLDCAVASGQKCIFTDWETGPTLAIFTEDVSGEMMHFEVDASWIRDDLTAFRQDDFVWLVVRDDAGPVPVAVGVIEHRCNDGRVALGQANQGRSDGQRCY